MELFAHSFVTPMEKEQPYNNFTIKDFLCDTHFQDWVIHPNPEKDLFWQQWLLRHPEKLSHVTTAKEILQNLDFKVTRPSAEKAQQSLEKTLVLIDAMERSKPASGSILVRFNKLWRVAAILIVVVGIGLLAYFINTAPDTNEIATAYGKLDTLLLPDQSTVVLNANSNIRYNEKWEKGQPRELWLKGEAFFSVKHLDTDRKIEPHERFIVHVEAANIEVLGTVFNIRERRGKTEVVLRQGSIKVSFTDKTRPDIIMKPGDMVTIDPAANEKVVTATTDAANYTAWTNKRLVLNNPTLREITNYLEDTYGKKFVIRDPKLADKRVNGPILIDSLNDALFVISTVLNVTITAEGNTLVVEPG